VATAVAHAVGLAIGAGEAAAELARLLGERRVLVVLDNAEHVRDELAAVLDHLLEHTARPRFLVTSRLPLDLPDERRYPVSPLDCADPSAPGVRLLLAAAERVGAPAPDPGTAQRICQHLDGLPLAIELAGAQLRVLAADEVAARLDERFDLLRERHRPGRERHASLTAVLDGSWSLLEPDERAVLSRLAAFPGPFALADAEQLCFDLGPAVGVLARLVDRSLVAGPSDGRFRLLETVRLYAGRRGDARAEADRHARWCRDGVGPDLEAHVFDGPAAAWCTGHHDDIAAAERHLLATGRPAEAALLLAGTALAMQCDAGSHAAAALGRVDRLLTRVAGDPALTARLHITGVFAGMPARAPEAIAEHGRLAVAAAEVAGDPLLRSVALVLHSWSVVFVDPAEAIAMTERAAALAGDTDRARDLADGYRAFHLAVARRYPEAVALAEVVRGRSPSGHDAGQGRVVAVHAIAACCAVPEPQRALECLPELFDTPSESTVMWTSEVLAAAVLASCGRVAEAEGMLQRARVRLAAAGRDGLPDVLVPAAVLAHRLGDDARAARWLAAVRGHGRTTHSFHTTCVYRRLREAVGAPAAPPPSAAEAFQEATDWLRTLPA
jgi:predicted ATPase